MPHEPNVLCVNTGSSSLKVALWHTGPRERLLASGAVERIGQAASRLWLHVDDHRIERPTEACDHRAATASLLDALQTQALPRPDAVGHRVVHGGPDHSAPEVVDAQMLRTLRELQAFAPLHLPASIEAIEAACGRFEGVPQVVCFDTAFHQDMPEVARRLPLPRALWDRGVRRYGFHGLSYEYISQALGEEGRGRVIIAHLGSGASLAAVRDGRSVDTTMGLTPCGGLVMGTRSGDLDPGVLLHLLRTRSYDVTALEHLVEHEAGLLGISGSSSNMEVLLGARGHDEAAALAVDAFTYSLRRHIGALSAVLGGIDTLVFTGGIGQHAAPIREAVCAPLAYLGIALNATANAAHASVISSPTSPCMVRVMATNEELMIARHTASLLANC